MKDLIRLLIKKYPQIANYIDETEPEEPIIILVNGEPAKQDRELKNNDEVFLFPPASGGLPPEGLIIEDNISIDNVIEDMKKKPEFIRSGAVVVFIGFVKGLIEDDIEVYELLYDAYKPFANAKLKEIAEEYSKRPNVVDVRIYHKVSRLKPKETTVYIFVSAIDRKTAFNVAKEVLERVKHEAPIWKLEIRSDGEFWVLGDGKRVPRPKPKLT